jgi:predicted LPLAT superfamily acyltransferase
MRLFGHTSTRLLLAPITFYYALVAGDVRRNLREFHRRVGGDGSFWAVWRSLFNFAESIMDRFFVLAGRADLFRLTVHNRDLALRRQAEGRGAIVVGGHLGIIEIARAFPQCGDIVVNVLIYNAISPMLYRELRRVSPDVERGMIFAEPESVGYILDVRERIASGEFVAVLADRVWVRGQAVRLPFLGADAEFPTGPFLLARSLKCPLLLMFLVKEGRRDYHMYIEELASAEDVSVGDRHQAVDRLARRFVERLEAFVRAHPFQWYNFHPFWSPGGER